MFGLTEIPRDCQNLPGTQRDIRGNVGGVVVTAASVSRLIPHLTNIPLPQAPL